MSQSSPVRLFGGGRIFKTFTISFKSKVYIKPFCANVSLKICILKILIFRIQAGGGGEGGGTSIWGVHGGLPRVRVIFSRKKSEKGM